MSKNLARRSQSLAPPASKIAIAESTITHRSDLVNRIKARRKIHLHGFRADIPVKFRPYPATAKPETHTPTDAVFDQPSSVESIKVPLGLLVNENAL
jgi:hypothetical protein